jgi:flagellar basal-body rod protein FlgB
MSLLDTTDLSLQAAIRGAGLRQTALSQNIANANTPGYQRKDVDFESSLRAAMTDGTNPDSLQFGVETDASAPMQPDGNSVDIDAESAKLAENGINYESLVSVEKTRLEILQSAMGASS